MCLGTPYHVIFSCLYDTSKMELLVTNKIRLYLFYGNYLRHYYLVAYDLMLLITQSDCTVALTA